MQGLTRMRVATARMKLKSFSRTAQTNQTETLQEAKFHHYALTSQISANVRADIRALMRIWAKDEAELKSVSCHCCLSQLRVKSKR